MDARLSVVVLCLAVLVSASTAGAAGQTTDDGTAEADIEVRYVVDRLPERTGVVEVTAVVDVPEQVTDLSVRLPNNASVQDADGFRPTEPRWQWDSETEGETAELTYVVPVGLRTAYGQRTADTDEWSLLARREVALHARWRWQRGTDPKWTERMVVAPGQSGVAGSTAAYLGPYDSFSRETRDGTVRVVVPEAASLRANRTRILDTVASAQRASRLGPDDDRVTIFAAPNSLAPGGYTPANGEPVVMVNAGEPVATPTNVWVHEYYHTRQTYRTTAEMRWLDEGSADYYAARWTLQQGYIDTGQYRNRVTTDRYENVDLTRPERWPSPDVQYDKGTRVVAAIDARLWQVTDGNATFVDVLARLERADEPVTLDTFADAVSAVAGEDVDAFVRAAVTGPAPPVPTDTAYVASLDAGGHDRQRNATTGGAADPVSGLPDFSGLPVESERVGGAAAMLTLAGLWACLLGVWVRLGRVLWRTGARATPRPRRPR
ncbi:hypothetical protein [Haloarcula marina]|uniref:hypothetical protein n=1 Tax=Haloarcula marina TaxID=2961574 RepID=UPI0020B8DC56|nr:hypothetical protein [Halomicroarcula marina]